MTELLFLKDAYVQEFEATVTAQMEGGVVLDRTAFYPGGGGQPCDFGRLQSGELAWDVVKVQKMNGQVVHFVDGALPGVGTATSASSGQATSASSGQATSASSGQATSASSGQAVIGKLDWERRYQLMRTHTAMHILCGVVWRDYGAQVTGGNMEPLQGRMDFEFETMRQELVAEIEKAVNEEVAAARDVRVQILSREEAFQIPDLIRTKINLLPAGITEIRTVELVGLDLQADGGTHVHNTSEVGVVKIVNYKSKGKINKRIYVEIE